MTVIDPLPEESTAIAKLDECAIALKADSIELPPEIEAKLVEYTATVDRILEASGANDSTKLDNVTFALLFLIDAHINKKDLSSIDKTLLSETYLAVQQMFPFTSVLHKLFQNV